MLNSIIFIDANVTDYESLIASFGNDVEFHALNPTKMAYYKSQIIYC